jgi:hypothetical protein
MMKHKRRLAAMQIKPETYVPGPMTREELAGFAMTQADWEDAFAL